MLVRLSTRPNGTTGLLLDVFSWNMIFEFLFSKMCRICSKFIMIRQGECVLYMKTFIHFWSHLAEFFLKWEIFRTKFVEKVVTYFMFSSFFRKLCNLRDKVEKYGRAGQTTDNDMIRLMRFVCWIKKDIDMDSEYVIVTFFLFSRLQWWRESASVLKLTLTLHVLTFF